MSPNALWASVLADELARAGLRHAVIAPGSRSTPLVLALAGHPDVADHSVIDERSAAFFALGIARGTGAPAAVVTTSGTAAANLLPAVVEADRSGVPLLLLTADRPPERRDAGDSQAADQVKMFGGFVRWFHAVAEPSTDDDRLAYLRSTACEAWARATGGAGGGPPGPVHLNLPFRKPLEPAADDRPPAGPDEGAAGSGAAGRPGGAPWRRTSAPAGEPDPAIVEELALALAGSERPLILAGALTGVQADAPGPSDPEPLRAAVARLTDALPVPVWAEATSNLRGVPGVVATADLLLAAPGFRSAIRLGRGPETIDLVLRLGEAPLTWPLRRLTSELPAAALWQIDRWGRRHDPEHAVHRSIAADPARTLDAVAAWLETRRPDLGRAAGGGRGAWLALHRRADRAAREALRAASDDAREPGDPFGPLFDGGVFPRLARRLPDDAALVVSSSMPLRELEAFFAPPQDPERRIDVFANRGVNGIDGVTSTAAGIAEARRVVTSAGSESRTVLVTGDVAFAHDLSGALAAGRPTGQGPGLRSGSDLTVVLIDNGGGAIFDHLPLAAMDDHRAAFERHFATPPGIDFGAVARGLGWSYARVDDGGGWPAFDRALADALGTPEDPPGPPPRLIHVCTGREPAKRLREELIGSIAAAVDRALEEDGTEDGREAGPRPDPAAAGPTVPVARPPAARLPASGHPVPVLLLHGFTGSGLVSGGSLRPLADRLAAAGHPVIAPDLPGHGAESVPSSGAGAGSGATLEAAVAVALSALDRRGLRRAAWVGYSMGGRVALAAALEHPERVAGLALLSASPGIEDEAERAARREADEALARTIENAADCGSTGQGLAGFVDRWMAQPLFAGEARPDREGGHRRLRRDRAERLAGSARGYAASLRGMGQGAPSKWGPSLWGRLGELRASTLLVTGAEDEKYVEIARRMAEALRDAPAEVRVEVIPGAGHAVHREAPDRAARAILEWITALGGE